MDTDWSRDLCTAVLQSETERDNFVIVGGRNDLADIFITEFRTQWERVSDERMVFFVSCAFTNIGHFDDYNHDRSVFCRQQNVEQTE